MQSRLKIAIDGTVLARAITNVLSRTGVYFVTLNLAEALATREDVTVSVVVEHDLAEMTRESLLPFKISRLINNPEVRFGTDRIFFIHPFFPAPKSSYTIPEVIVVQIVHDLAFHACAELSADKAGQQFEKNLVGSMNNGGYALCVSNTTKHDLCRIFNFPEERVGFFHPGLRTFKKRLHDVPQAIADVKSRYGVPNSSKYVVALSTLEPRKNIETTLNLFELFLRRNPNSDLYLLFIGAQGWGGQMEKMRHVKPETLMKVRVLGYVPDETVEVLLEESLCLLYPSLYEGFGMPPLEALSLGTPVICSNRGSLSEILQDQVPVFDPYDTVGMVDRLERFYYDSYELQKAVDCGERVAGMYTWQRASNMCIDYLLTIKHRLNN
jgi:glycosyltransferase involved in cell wall biosynthesis